MNTIQELIKSYDEAVIRLVSEAVEASMPDDAKARLYSAIHGHVSGGHFDECFAREAVGRMYYTDDSGERHHGPYFTDAAVREWYAGVRDLVPEYNLWDFCVTVNMAASDYRDLVMRWFPDSSPEDREKKYVELAVNWLADEDNPFGTSKVWGYLNPSR